MDPELDEIKKRLEALPRSGRKRRYTADLKRRVVAYVQRQVAEGKTESAVSRELGLFQGTVSDWRTGGVRTKPRKQTTVRPVELARNEKAPALTLVLGDEARVEGLSLAQVIEVVKALR